MSRKITLISIILISLVSIAIVAFFGVVPQATPKEIPATEIMFVDRKGGTEENKIKKTSSTITITQETMEIYYYISPVTATGRDINILLNDYGKNSNMTAEKTDEGVILIDFHGTMFSNRDMFTIHLTQLRDSRTVEHTYIVKK